MKRPPGAEPARTGIRTPALRLMKTKCNLVIVSSLLTWVLSTIGQPIITRQPADQSVSLGANVTFSVGSSSSTPLYQWRFNALELLSATNPTLVLTNVQIMVSGG